MKYFISILSLIFSSQACSESSDFLEITNNSKIYLPVSEQYYHCDFDVENVVSFYSTINAYTYSYFSTLGFADKFEDAWNEIGNGVFSSQLSQILIPLSGKLKVMNKNVSFIYLAPENQAGVKQNIILVRLKTGVIIGQEYIGRTRDEKSCLLVSGEELTQKISQLITDV